MKTSSVLRLIPALWLAIVSAAWSADAAMPPELHGILATGREHRFMLVASGGAHSGWVTVGRSFDGWTLVKYIPAEDAVVLSGDGRQVTVHLNTSVVGEADPAHDIKATVADADDLLSKMKFEAMWDRIAEEQKKGIVSSMRQQAAPEFARHGLPPEEIDRLLDKMGEAIVAGMQSDVMREDFARIYSEVYTKDELRGMAAFYDTTAGKAWVEKQPAVQQKLMQAMMPRVMQGMPAAQKVAADYLRQRAAAPANRAP